jgi:hypothetical protein
VLLAVDLQVSIPFIGFVVHVADAALAQAQDGAGALYRWCLKTK